MGQLFRRIFTDEDFVEGFKMFVPRNTKLPLRTFKRQIPVADSIIIEDIPETCSQRSALMEKLECLAQALC